MRCVYHGWKYGLDGQCLEMPSEPPESGFASKVKHTAYPCEERGGIIWAYMGPASPPPPLPDLEWTLLPEAHVFISKRVQDCNWFQAMEGGIDSSHISFLHAPIDHRDAEVTRGIDRASFGVGAAVRDRRPRPALRGRGHRLRRAHRGAALAARRALVLAHHAVPDALLHDAAHRRRREDRPVPHLGADGRHPPGELDGDVASRARAHRRGDRAARAGKGAHVCDYLPATSEPYGDIRTAANRDNDYWMDWEAHRTRMFCGIPGFGVQDQAIQESQGRHRRPHARAIGHERHRDHPGAPAPHDGGPRASRSGRPGARR